VNEPTVPIRVKGIDHVTLVVRDLARSGDFYLGLLGMEEIDRPRFPFPGRWFAAGGTQVHLILEMPGTPRAGVAFDRERVGAGMAGHFAFEVDDAVAAADRLREHGIAIMGGPARRPDGCIQVWFYDPDGHVVEVFHRP
jgi:glyoxylase I family protein